VVTAEGVNAAVESGVCAGGLVGSRQLRPLCERAELEKHGRHMEVAAVKMGEGFRNGIVGVNLAEMRNDVASPLMIPE